MTTRNQKYKVNQKYTLNTRAHRPTTTNLLKLRSRAFATASRRLRPFILPP